MKAKVCSVPRPHALLPALLIAAGIVLAGCNSDTGTAPTSGASPSALEVSDANSPPQPAADVAPIADADFEGTIQQLTVSIAADEISAFAGSSDLAAILALAPEDVIEAVNNGKIDATMVEHATMEIDGRMARIQAEGKPMYTILDGEQVAAHVVDPSSKMVMTMDAAKMAAARAKSGKSLQIDAKPIGEQTIRGFDATGYRFKFMRDYVTTAWLSEELESEVGPIFDIMSAVNPFGPMEIGEGAPVRSVMVNSGALSGTGNPFLPAYTITEFYNPVPGTVDDQRFELPQQGYQRRNMSDLGRGTPPRP